MKFRQIEAVKMQNENYFMTSMKFQNRESLTFETVDQNSLT